MSSKIFDSTTIDNLRAIFSTIYFDFETNLIKVDGEAGHLHFQFEYPPNVSLSTLINRPKGRLQRGLAQTVSSYTKLLLERLRSPSHFAAYCGGTPIRIIRQYIN
ncbi:MAG: transposase [Nitrospiria bacterium]